MTVCQTFRSTSSKDVDSLIKEVYHTAKTKVDIDRVEEIYRQLAVLLEKLLINYQNTIRKQKLLTEVYEQKQERIQVATVKIKETLSDINNESSKFTSITALNLDKISERIDKHVELLQTIGQKLENEIKNYENIWTNKISVAKQILKIPDLVKELGNTRPLVQCIINLENQLHKSSDENEKIETLKTEWKRLTEKFSEYETIESFEGLKERYGFSQKTIDVIKMLLNGQQLSFSSISSDVLSQLKKFKDFCDVIKLEFQSVERDF